MLPDAIYTVNAMGLVNKMPDVILFDDTFQGVLSRMREEGWVSNQVNYVAHSMGGCMLRSLMDNYSDDFYGRGTNTAYKNYQKGFVHKFITINTPHNGSPIADVVTGLSPYLSLGKRLLFSSDIYANSKLSTNFFKPSDASLKRVSLLDPVYDFVASPAVIDLQTNTEFGGIKFKNTPLQTHFIAGDIATGIAKPASFKVLPYVGGALRLYQLINGASSAIKSLGNATLNPKTIPEIFGFAKGVYATTKLITMPNRFYIASKTNFDLIWGNSFDFTDKSDEAVQKTLDLYGYWNSKYSDFSYNSDLVVPLNSQIAGITSGNQITILQDPSIISSISKFNHLSITDQIETSNEVKILLNKAVGSNYFNTIAASPISSSVSSSSLADTKYKPSNSLNSNVVYEKYDTTRIKITNPLRNFTITDNRTLSIKAQNLGDTLGLKSVSVVFAGNWKSDSSKNSTSTFIMPNSLSNRKTLIIATAQYSKNDTTFMYFDSLSISIRTSEALTKFSVNPQSKNVAIETVFLPDYLLAYNTFASRTIDLTKLNISILNTSCLSYNTQTGQFKGLQKGEAVVIFTYDSIFKDTMYVAVGGGGVPYMQQISTSNVPVTGDGTICTGATISVPFATTGGVFDVGNQYIVQLSDASGENFVSLETSGITSPLSARIPNGLSNADTYKIRVVSTSPPVIGTVAVQPIKIRNQDIVPIVSVKTGNWNDANTWSCGRIPIITNNITIAGGHTVAIPNGQTGFANNLIQIGTLLNAGNLRLKAEL